MIRSTTEGSSNGRGSLINRRVLRIAIALAWLSALIAPSAMPVAAAGSRATDLGPALQSVIDQQRASINIPGVAATVIFGDGSRWTGVSGDAALNPDSAVTEIAQAAYR